MWAIAHYQFLIVGQAALAVLAGFTVMWYLHHFQPDPDLAEQEAYWKKRQKDMEKWHND